MKQTWPKPPGPKDERGGTFVEEPRQVPMFDRGPSGAAPSWETPRVIPTECKHGKGSCEACGTTNRRDSGHTTEGGRGAVGRIRRP